MRTLLIVGGNDLTISARRSAFLDFDLYGLSSTDALVLKWSIPPAEENSPTRARLHTTPSYLLSSRNTVELALEDLDTQLRPHYPLTITLSGSDSELRVLDLRARLPEIMPHAHRLGLINIEAASDNKQ